MISGQLWKVKHLYFSRIRSQKDLYCRSCAFIVSENLKETKTLNSLDRIDSNKNETYSSSEYGGVYFA